MIIELRTLIPKQQKIVSLRSGSFKVALFHSFKGSSLLHHAIFDKPRVKRI